MKRSEALDILADFSEKFSNQDDFEFSELNETIQKTVSALKEYPNMTGYVDSDFLRIMNDYDGCFALEYTQIFSLVMKQKNTEEQKAYLHKLCNINPSILSDFEELAIKQNTELADEVFKRRLQCVCKNGNPLSFCPQIINLVKAAPTAEKCEKMLKTAFDNSVSQKSRNQSMLSISGIYKKYPQLIDSVFDIIKNEKKNKYYLEAMADIAVFDEYKAEDALYRMREHFESGSHDKFMLQKYYYELKKISDALPKFKQMAQDFGRDALKFAQHCAVCKKLAARLLEDESVLLSNISVGTRTDKSRSNRIGYKKVERVGSDETCVIFIGGNGALDDKAAHGYIKPVIELLKEHKMSNKVNVYGLSYDFGDYFNTQQALEAQMKKYGHRPVHLAEFLNNMHSDTQNPQFVEQIFNKFILPRISLLDGKVRISAQEAARKMNKLKIVAHCLGGYVALKLEEMSLKTMEKLGYDKQERLLVQKQMQIIAMNPYCPLGVQKSDMFSLISAQDREVTHNNFFEKFVRHQVNKGKIIPISYFDEKMGNFVLVNRMYGSDNHKYATNDIDEHSYFGFKVLPAHSESGKIALSFMQNALLNGLKSALRDEIRDLPPQKLLTSNAQDRRNFIVAETNGKELHAKAVEYMISENNKAFVQKQRK